MFGRFGIVALVACALVVSSFAVRPAAAPDVNVTLVAYNNEWHRNTNTTPPEPTIQANAGDTLVITLENHDAAAHTFTVPHFSVDIPLPGFTLAAVNIPTSSGDVGLWQFWCSIHASGPDPENYTGMIGWFDIAPSTGPDVDPPVITHTPVTSGTVGTAITIRANVTDNVGVQEVRLNYTDVSGANQNVTMTLQAGNYTATIPAQSSAGNVSYFIYATDAAGNAITSAVYAITITQGSNPPGNGGAANYTAVIVGILVLFVLLVAVMMYLRRRRGSAPK